MGHDGTTLPLVGRPAKRRWPSASVARAVSKNLGRVPSQILSRRSLSTSSRGIFYHQTTRVCHLLHCTPHLTSPHLTCTSRQRRKRKQGRSVQSAKNTAHAAGCFLATNFFHHPVLFTRHFERRNITTTIAAITTHTAIAFICRIALLGRVVSSPLVQYSIVFAQTTCTTSFPHLSCPMCY